MVNDERYLTLYASYADAEGTGIPIEVSLEELADKLFCTTRNVKLIVRKLEEDGMIEWSAGRGRGNRSKMTFLIDKGKKLMELAEHYAMKGEYQYAFELIQTYGEGTSVRQHFVEWMNGHFGYQIAQEGEAEVDMLRLPVYRPIITLDTKNLYYAFSAHMVKQLFNTLVVFDRDAGRIMPSLAHAWEVDAAGKEWTFHLRKGVLFHHGRELVAEDVVYSLERLKGSTASGWYVRSVAEVEKRGVRTVVIKLDKPNWLFLRFLCASALSIVPHELVRQDERFWTHPIGTGPFRFVDWKQDRFTMEANPQYFQGRAHLDGIMIAVLPESSAMFTKSWEQLLVDHDLKDIEPEQGWKRIEYVCNGCSLLTWNLGKPGPQKSFAFRKAVDLLINRSRMIEELGEDRIYPAWGFFPNEDLYGMAFHADCERAAALLKESGYKGEPIRIGVYGIHEQDARWLQRELAAYGIVIEVQVETWLTVREPDVLRNFDCMLYCVVFAEDEVCMIELFEQSGNFMREQLDSELLAWVKEKIDAALACRTEEERWTQLMDIEGRLREEAHVSFLLHKKLNTFYNPNIKGVGVNSLGWIDFKDIWLEKETLSESSVGAD
ncbi:ABC transporter substrate-binding protein [Paenibacillus sp. LHD-117]|uniref:SgrR family transcriptional regulator n=1 Tax=Paenibacillus sp. LHD-117 TaxID=3071412 RepID=UPI0027E0A399|nr:ABC transporter substrate-binding protein [Paenibacillus sp. LHD-117]MDQ6423636.1 ABC transporter substrate-binding protein [Paenibacillus sp. LHD-117]